MKFKEGEKVRAVRDVAAFGQIAITKGNTYDVTLVTEETIKPDLGEEKTIEIVGVFANDGMPFAFNSDLFEKNSKYRVGDDVCFDEFGQWLAGRRKHYKITKVGPEGDYYIFRFNDKQNAHIHEEHITGLYEEKLEEKPVESDGDKKPSGLQKAILEAVFPDRPAPDAFGKRFDATDALHYSLDVETNLASVASKNDPVLHPSHYNQGGIEAIDALEAATCNLSGWKATLTYQSMKYMWRWNEKGKPLEDLKKARFYLDRLISKVEKELKEEGK